MQTPLATRATIALRIDDGSAAGRATAMDGLWIDWLQLAACAAAILVAGSRLTRYGDAIARHTGLGGSWIGLVLMATVTSLPELAVTITSVRIGALDLAIGNLVGSNLFNLSLLGVDDLLFLRGPLLAAVERSHAMSAIAAAVMSGALIVALVARPTARLLNAIGWTSVLIALVYFVNTWLHFRHGG